MTRPAPGTSPAARVLVGVLAGLVGAALTVWAATTWWARPSDDPPSGQLTIEVVATYPHDPAAFTQGLELHAGLLYESTGRYGQSDVRVTEPATGEVLRRVPLPDEFFGEGLTVVGDRIWQLTWREGVALRRDRTTLEELDRVAYRGEGWGLCYDEPRNRLVMSDGSATLTFRDPETFAPLGTLRVHRGGRPVKRLNELECVGGTVWANVWLTDEIVAIDVTTGRVVSVVDASGLLPEADRAGADVLNGLAHVPGRDTFLVTGKLWPTVFEVRFQPPPPRAGGWSLGPPEHRPLGAPAHRSTSPSPSAGTGGRSTAAHGSCAGRSRPSGQACR